ncbi:putative type IX secretion system sortase PorU2 [Arundinibacter roseus]|uniref:Gingipain domain-containing protein n=1 Tax=Arundinibacter roseus TaxID=2070510 RepID=A0A4R4KCV3_9BACT|nr:C25 family cysteine peptidase [Arundinibacter roseus]TDB64139.1 hypothetical protein EZE20_14460 [Arundinibacter roseus]
MPLAFRLFLCFLFVGFQAIAQAPYGNEWINPEQNYLRLGIRQEGWYRLGVADLRKHGFHPDSIPAHSLQLFRRGKEVAIHVKGEADGQLDSEDFIEFYGQSNDGQPDSLLYVNSAAMPHPHYSLYSDTAAYFLTWRTDALPGRRITTTAVSATAEKASFHTEKVRQIFTRDYPAGAIYPYGAWYDDGYILTPYDVGEGWTGPARGTNQWETLRLQTVNPLREAFAQARVKILFVGRFAGEHLVEVWVGNATKQSRKLGEISWKDYNTTLFQASLQPQDLLDDGTVQISFVPRKPGESVSASYVAWEYPQQLLLPENTSQKHFYPTGSGDLSFENISEDVRFFDVSNPENPRQLLYNSTSTGIRFSPQNDRDILLVSQPLAVTNLRKVEFKTVLAANYNYLILTHPLMRKPVAGSADPVADYAAYRASTAGGNFSPLILNADEVADRFNYGEPGPLGIRRALRWLHEQGKLEFMFIIGRSRSPQIVRPQTNAREEDMVPSAGWPDSDIALGMNLDAANPNVPLVPIGRLNAYTSQNVWDYFQKVKQHESAPSTAPWRKNILHLSGGRSVPELSNFKGFVNTYQSKIIASGLAPAVQTISKQTTDPVEKFDIAPLVNQGLALVTLFGHSSLTVTDIDVGFASNDALGYRNQGRYPAVIANGCAVGNFYFGPTPLSTDWVLTPNRGAILFLAHTHNGLVGPMHAYSQWMYEVLADSAFTSLPFGTIMKEAVRRYMRSRTLLTDRITVQQMNLQGDPAIRIFPATRPDYQWDEPSLRISNFRGTALTALDDSLRVQAVVQNNGRFRQQTYTVRLRRSLGDALLDEILLHQQPIYIRDTLNFTIPNLSRQSGTELWQLSLDPENEIDEEDENNNEISIPVEIGEGGAVPLLPEDGARIDRSPILLVAQIPEERLGEEVVFEWATEADFQKLMGQASYTTNARIVRHTLILPDSARIFWRVFMKGDSAQRLRSFRFGDDLAATPQLPEGIAYATPISPLELTEGAPFETQVTFENSSQEAFKDSIQIQSREFRAGRWLTDTFAIAPVAGLGKSSFKISRATAGFSGLQQIFITFNTTQLPEQLYSNNSIGLRYTVLPDRSLPVLDVTVDGRRLTNREAISSQATVQIRLTDANPFALPTDVSGFNVQILPLCAGCALVEIELQNALLTRLSPTTIQLETNLPALAAGDYELNIEGKDAFGNAATYQIQFRIADKNQVIAVIASPNPVTKWVTFSLNLEGKSSPSRWHVQVYDSNGKSIANLSKPAHLGLNELLWEPAGLAAGLYFYSLFLEGAEWPTAAVEQGKILVSH